MTTASAERPMVVLHVAPLIPTISGLNHAILSMVAAQLRVGLRAAILTTTDYRAAPEPWAELPLFQAGTLADERGLAGLPEPFCAPDLVHFHSLYDRAQARLAAGLRRRGVPYVLTPHCALTRGAQSQRRLKKLAGNLLFQARMVGGAAGVQFTTVEEAEASLTFGARPFIVPHGVRKTTAAVEPPADAQDPRAPLRLLFVGRLDTYQKGLDLLLHGLQRFTRRSPQAPVRLRLVGPDYRGQQRQLRELSRRLGLDAVVELAGPAAPDALAEQFGWAHLFVHTSRFEAQSLSVNEALCHGLPCLVTPGTGWGRLVGAADAGWQVEPTPEAIAAGIGRAFERRQELPALGRRARSLVEGLPDWEGAAQLMAATYRELCAGGMRRAMSVAY